MLRGIRTNKATIALMTLGAVVAIHPLASVAEDYASSSKSPSRAIMRNATSRAVKQAGGYGTDSGIAHTLSLPPLPGDQGFTDSAEKANTFAEGNSVPDFGINDRINKNIVLPPLKGLSQIMDSDITKDYLKQAVTSKSAVLMQTMMMVENGAATGFAHSMSMGSNFYSNLVNTTDLQMKMMDVTDETGQMKVAFVNGVAEKMQGGKGSTQKDIWPGALYEQMAEDGKFDKNAIKKLPEPKPYDLSGILLGKSDSSSAPKDKRLLSEMLFVKGSGSGGKQAHANEQIDQLRQEFVKLVGDLEIKIEAGKTPSLSRDVTITYKAPEADQSDTRRGVAALNWEEVGVVWENMNKLLSDVCEWKKNNGNNAGKEVFQMENLSTTKDIGKSGSAGNPWELSSSPDMPMTINLIEQIYKIIEDNPTQVGGATSQPIDCQALALKPSDIPNDSATGGSTTNFNDCGKNKGCLKNRVVLHISFLMARSRALHTYLNLYTISRKFVSDPRIGQLLDQAFVRAFSGMDMMQEIHDNRARYFDFIVNMGQYLQGDSGAGNIMRPGESFIAQGAKTGFSGK